MSGPKDRHGSSRPPNDDIPDVRDGLTRLERVVLYKLRELERERPGRPIPTMQLYGRVVDLVDCSQEEVQLILQRFTGNHYPR